MTGVQTCALPIWKDSVFVFLPSSAVPTEHGKRFVDRILSRLTTNYDHVWHNSPWIEGGSLCSHLDHFSKAVRSSTVLLIIDNLESIRTDNDLKLLNWVAAEFEKAGPKPSAVISNDVILSRLRLPICFARSVFLAEREDSENGPLRPTELRRGI